MKIDKIIPSTLKVTASEQLNISADLKAADSEKPLELILNEQKQQKEQKTEDR
jgi:hypothetical protein